MAQAMNADVDKLSERFWSKVETRGEDECWPWLGPVVRDGRGVMWAFGRNITAPRLAVAFAYHEWPSDHLFACHRCDNPNCVNPDHIWLASNKDNLIDAGMKGLLNGQDKTHCMRGHEFTPENTLRNAMGNRQCRACQHVHQRRYMAKVRARRGSSNAALQDQPTAPAEQS